MAQADDTSTQLNERTSIRTIVKWSKSALLLAGVLIVLLVTAVLMQKAYAQVDAVISISQEEASKIKSKLDETSTELETVKGDKELLAEKVLKLEEENAQLKE